MTTTSAEPSGPFSAALPGYSFEPLLRALPASAPAARAPVVFRGRADDFVVDELPAYLPCGEGEHLYLKIEKRERSTSAVVRDLCARFRLREHDVGYAGRKDERAVSRQWLSVPARALQDQAGAFRIADVEAMGVRVLEHARHKNKLRLGHLRGNAFTVRLAGDVDEVALAARLALVEDGIPNLFGAQRFGPRDESLRQAERFVARRQRARSRKETYWVSVVQSAIFNAWLADRVDDGTWRTPQDGDVLWKLPNCAPFDCTDAATDGVRAAAREVVVAGPLVGAGMRSAQREALTRESRSLVRLGVDAEALRAHPAFEVGARRAAVLWPSDVACTRTEDGVALAFSLTKGAFASVVLHAVFGPLLVDAAFADGGADTDLHGAR
ncbi:MAG: tRNA pseudouridine(13) synthase TruD [Deltaproteobacteria bacterium]|nr:tRNA pseudouridine(13) synthase TruD [Deltaproteobacteria bacterium]